MRLGCATDCSGGRPPSAWPPIRAGEIDGRYIDLTADLGAVDDQITDLSTVEITITRRDGFPMTGSDLAVAGAAWPNSLDATHLILDVGLTAGTAAGYNVVLTVDKTMQGRLLIRDLTIDVVSTMG